MQHRITRNALYQMEQELMHARNNSPLLCLLLQPRIKQFVDRTEMQSKITHERFKVIQERFVQKDEAGNFIMDGEGDKQEWKYITAKEDLEKAHVLDVAMVKQEYDKACKALFSQIITIDI